MNVVAVDPREQTWEIEQPAYRVYFHDSTNSSEEYQVSGADVEAVLEWAKSACGSGTFVVYACVPTDGLGLIRLAGRDPNVS